MSVSPESPLDASGVAITGSEGAGNISQVSEPTPEGLLSTLAKELSTSDTVVPQETVAEVAEKVDVVDAASKKEDEHPLSEHELVEVSNPKPPQESDVETTFTEEASAPPAESFLKKEAAPLSETEIAELEIPLQSTPNTSLAEGHIVEQSQEDIKEAVKVASTPFAAVEVIDDRSAEGSTIPAHETLETEDEKVPEDEASSLKLNDEPELDTPAISESIPTIAALIQGTEKSEPKAAIPPALASSVVEEEEVSGVDEDSSVAEVVETPSQVIVEVDGVNPVQINDTTDSHSHDDNEDDLSSNQATAIRAAQPETTASVVADKDDGDSELAIEPEMTFAAPSTPTIPASKLPQEVETALTPEIVAEDPQATPAEIAEEIVPAVEAEVPTVTEDIVEVKEDSPAPVTEAEILEAAATASVKAVPAPIKVEEPTSAPIIQEAPIVLETPAAVEEAAEATMAEDVVAAPAEDLQPEPLKGEAAVEETAVETVPVVEDFKSEDAVVAVEEPALVEVVETAPAEEVVAPVVEETVSVEEVAPVVEEAASVFEATPIVEEVTSVAEEATPVVEAVPVVEEVAPSQNVAAVEETTPVVEETPAPIAISSEETVVPAAVEEVKEEEVPPATEDVVEKELVAQPTAAVAEVEDVKEVEESAPFVEEAQVKAEVEATVEETQPEVLAEVAATVEEIQPEAPAEAVVVAEEVRPEALEVEETQPEVPIERAVVVEEIQLETPSEIATVAEPVAVSVEEAQPEVPTEIVVPVEEVPSRAASVVEEAQPQVPSEVAVTIDEAQPEIPSTTEEAAPATRSIYQLGAIQTSHSTSSTDYSEDSALEPITPSVEELADVEVNDNEESHSTEAKEIVDPEIQRPKSPWAPSFTVTTLGGPTAEEPVEDEEPSEKPAVSLVVTDDDCKVEANEEPSATPVPRPWTPSYSVHSQGSPMQAPAPLENEVLETVLAPETEPEHIEEPEVSQLEDTATPEIAVAFNEPEQLEEPFVEEASAKDLIASLARGAQFVESVSQANLAVQEPEIAEAEVIERSATPAVAEVEEPSQELAAVPTQQEKEAEVAIKAPSTIPEPEVVTATEEVKEEAEVVAEERPEIATAPTEVIDEVPETEKDEPAVIPTVEEPEKLEDVETVPLVAPVPVVGTSPSSWIPSYSVSRQGSPLPKALELEAEPESIVPQAEEVTAEETPASQSKIDVVEDVVKEVAAEELAAASVPLSAESEEQKPAVRSLTPASYSVTTQGAVDTEAAELEAAQEKPAEVPEPDAETTFAESAEVTNKATEELPALLTSVTAEGAAKEATFSSDDVDDLPSPSSPTDDKSVTRRSRIESIASSRFFPGGWFSQHSHKVAEAGRTSLETATGQFIPVKELSSPEEPTPSLPPLTTENLAAPANAEEIHSASTKKRYCTIM